MNQAKQFGLLLLSLCLSAKLCFAIPQAPGKELAEGTIPYACTEGDFNSGASAYSVNYGYYYSAKDRQWASTPWCYPVWGYLAASAPQLVRVGEAITMYATPKDGSNSAAYAPETSTISWSYQGEGPVVSGCGPSDLSCTVKPFLKKKRFWQWISVQVSMPRTFFVDSPGEFCAGQHLCGGVRTNAWTFIGTPPCGRPSSSTVNVSMKNKTFSPSTIIVDPGTKVTMCNDDPFQQRPYTAFNLNWGDKKIEPGKCITYTVPKRIKRRANILIHDAIHTKMELKVIVKPNNC